VCQKKEMKLLDESAKVAELSKEKDQLKALNNKLNERVEMLQSIIDQQASANTFYYNYPPKDEPTDGDRQKKEKDSQNDKLKKIFEEQIAGIKRKND
jgi:regulator of replication initiation timing